MGNLTKLAQNFKKNKYNYISTAVIIAMILLLCVTCNNSKNNETETALLKVKLATSQDSEKLFIQKYDLSQAEISKYEDSIEIRDKRIAELEKKRVEVVRIGRKKIKSLKKYDKKAYSEYFKDRYKDFAKDVNVNETGINLTDSICKPIVTDLIKGDVAKAEVKILEDILSETQEKIELKDSIISNQEEQKIDLQNVINEKQKAQDAAIDIIKLQEKTITKKERQNAVLKVIVPVSAVIGVIIGVAVTK